MKHLQHILVVLLPATLWLTGCQGSRTSEDGTIETETTVLKSMAPQRVDIRGSIVMRRYNEGQVMLEAEGFANSQYSRYDRAYVLVLPTTEIVGPEGQIVNMNELQQGQNVAILLRGGGQGNFVGVGVARKVWLEEIL